MKRTNKRTNTIVAETASPVNDSAFGTRNPRSLGPDDPVMADSPLAVSPQFEARVRTLRRSTYSDSGVDIRPGTVHTGPDACVRTCCFPDTVKYQTNDTLCTCRARGEVTIGRCIHRQALASVGGVIGYYQWLKGALKNPNLRVCTRCKDLLDGHRDDVNAALCSLCSEEDATS